MWYRDLRQGMDNPRLRGVHAVGEETGDVGCATRRQQSGQRVEFSGRKETMRKV